MEAGNVYSKKVMRHFFHPKHMGRIKKPDAVGTVQNPVCKDTMHVYLRINKKTGKITDAKFETIGCAAAIASSDIACELAIGKTLSQAGKINNQQILRRLGKLPKVKEHCSLLGEQAIRRAIEGYLENYQKKD